MSLESDIKDIFKSGFIDSMKIQKEQLLRHRAYVKSTGKTHSPDAIDSEWVEKYAPDYRIMHDTIVPDVIEYIILNEKDMLLKDIVTEIVHDSEEQVFSHKWELSKQKGNDVGLAFSFKDWYAYNNPHKQGFIRYKIDQIKRRISPSHSQ